VLEHSLLRHEDLFHTGIVVDDLAAAMDDLGPRLGVTWTEGGGQIHLVVDGVGRPVRTAYAMSRQGPHHVELCQAVEGTFWTVAGNGHAHHLGYWTADVAATSAALELAGMRLVGSISFSPGRPPVCAYHQDRNGLYVEIVGAALRPILFPDPPGTTGTGSPAPTEV
jgi:Glyoxalase/Bleomycin resistance protein/Dioxygenase superfamily